MALLTYVTNAYPEAVKINCMMDPMVRAMMEENSSSVPWSDDEIFAAIDMYKQEHERETFEAIDPWKLVEPPRGFVQIIRI